MLSACKSRQGQNQVSRRPGLPPPQDREPGVFLWAFWEGARRTSDNSVASDSVQGAHLTGSTVPPASTVVGAWGSGTQERAVCSVPWAQPVSTTGTPHGYPPALPLLPLPPLPAGLLLLLLCLLPLVLPSPPPFPSSPSSSPLPPPPSLPPLSSQPPPHLLSFPPPFPSRDTTTVFHTKRRLLI